MRCVDPMASPDSAPPATAFHWMFQPVREFAAQRDAWQKLNEAGDGRTPAKQCRLADVPAIAGAAQPRGRRARVFPTTTCFRSSSGRCPGYPLVVGHTQRDPEKRCEILRHVFDAGRLRRIEFLGRLQSWQIKWCDEVRTIYHVNYYRWPLLANNDEVRRLRSSRQSADGMVAE